MTIVAFEKKKVAIIYYNAGLGHLREAIAVRDILKPCRYELVLVNFNEIISGFYNEMGKIYEKMQRNGLSNIVSAAWWRNPPDFLVKFINNMERKKEKRFTGLLEKYLSDNNIDFVIATHFFPAGALAFSEPYKKRTINICVDNMWKNSAWAYAVPGIKTIVPTAESYKNIFLEGRFGLEKKDIILAGHPFPPDLLMKKEDMHNMRLEKYSSDEPLNIVITTGGAGTNEKEMIEAIDGGKELIRQGKVNIILWCNHHAWLNENLSKKANSLGLGSCRNLKILNTDTRIDAVQGLHDQIKNADLLVTKPGELAQYGGIVPMYLFDPTASQEHSLADVSYQFGYSIDVKKIGAKNIIGYADTHRAELKNLAENGLNNPLIAMQEKNMLLNTINSIIK